jgi:hypothetical protein
MRMQAARQQRPCRRRRLYVTFILSSGRQTSKCIVRDESLPIEPQFISSVSNADGSTFGLTDHVSVRISVSTRACHLSDRAKAGFDSQTES